MLYIYIYLIPWDIFDTVAWLKYETKVSTIPLYRVWRHYIELQFDLKPINQLAECVITLIRLNCFQRLIHKNRATIHHIIPYQLNKITSINWKKHIINWNIWENFTYYTGTASILVHRITFISRTWFWRSSQSIIGSGDFQRCYSGIIVNLYGYFTHNPTKKTLPLKQDPGTYQKISQLPNNRNRYVRIKFILFPIPQILVRELHNTKVYFTFFVFNQYFCCESYTECIL